MFSFSIELTQNSKLYEPIVNHTPILTHFAQDTAKAIDEIYSLKDKYTTIANKEEYNYEAMDILLKHEIVTIDTVERLVNDGKLAINNIDTLISNYKGD